MNFIEFISEMPGLQHWALGMYEKIDKNAVKLGAELKKKDVATLRARAVDPTLTPNLRAPYIAMADALERDPTGRLAAIPSLYAWAMAPDGIGPHWISWYRNLVIAWIDHEKSPDHTARLEAETECATAQHEGSV